MTSNVMKGKAQFFLEKSITVHISCSNGRFYNGLIIEIVGEEFLIINDRLYGETPVYFLEIKGIERFTEK